MVAKLYEEEDLKQAIEDARNGHLLLFHIGLLGGIAFIKVLLGGLRDDPLTRPFYYLVARRYPSITSAQSNATSSMITL